MEKFQVHFGYLKGGFSPEKIEPLKFGGFKRTDPIWNKPKGSFWTCPLRWDKILGWSSDWLRYNFSFDYEINFAIIFEVKKNIEVVKIDSIKDLEKISTLRKFNSCGEEEKLRNINFERINQKNIAGIYVTAKGITELSDPCVGESLGIESIYGWDFESTAWLHAGWFESYHIHEVKDYRIVG